MSSHDTPPAAAGLPVSRRRRWLTVGGGLMGLMGVAAWAAQSRQHIRYDLPAYASWLTDPQARPADPVRHAALCGTLAANAHNTQPWRLRLAADRIEVHADAERWLGRADPQRHMQWMSLGCATENIRVAARRLGLSPEVEWRAGGRLDGAGRCATVHLRPGQSPVAEPLYEAIFRRSTNRGPYDMTQPPAEATLRQVAAAQDFSRARLSWHRATDIDGQEIALYTRYGVRQWLTDDERHRAGMHWWRADRDELLERRDGISIHTSDAPALVKQGMDSLVSPAQWRGEFGKTGEIHAVEKVLDATPVWGLITLDAEAGDEAQAVAQAGALLQRVYLEGTRRGLAVHPLNYATALGLLQTYSKPVLPISARWQPLLAFRFGRPMTEVEQAVRRDLGTTLL